MVRVSRRNQHGSTSTISKAISSSSSSSTTTTRRRGMSFKAFHEEEERQKKKAMISLALVCLWPLLICLLFWGRNTPNNDTTAIESGTTNAAAGRQLMNDNSSSSSSLSSIGGLRKKVKDLISRVDIVGYGVTHPRVAVVIVGNAHSNENDIIAAVESVFRRTDRNRILVVCVMMDGVKRNESLRKRLQTVDAGGSLHWHGTESHSHENDSTHHNHQHEQKLHIIFNPQPQGISASRQEAVHFITILERQHEIAGFKNKREDLLLLFLRQDARLSSDAWIDAATGALILSPYDNNNPQTNTKDALTASKLANAISFHVEGTPFGQITTFDTTLQKKHAMATAEELSQGNAESYPTPILDGAATVLRLHTYTHFPASDLALSNHFASDLELSFNLWLCADGIDVLPSMKVTTLSSTLPQHETHLLSDQSAVHLAGTWMDEHSMHDTFSAIAHSSTPSVAAADAMDHASVFDLLDQVKAAKDTPTFPSFMDKKCRPFLWYQKHINIHLPEQNENAAPNDDDDEDDNDQEGGEEVDNESSNKQRNHKQRPFYPLSEEKLRIVQGPKRMDLSYVDATEGHIDHPHRGAKDEHGKWGYVHDETALSKNPPKFVFDDKRAQCRKGDPNYRMLTEKVYVDLAAHEAAEKQRHNNDTPQRIKLFCVIYTTEKNHGRIPPILQTWGQKCDGFMVASTKTDKSIHTVELPHEGPEEYNNIWQKVRSIWAYVYDNYYTKYDWFHIGGDDLYVLVENLRLYLESDEIQLAANGGESMPTIGKDITSQVPLFLGRRFKEQGNIDRQFISGGSGYTINKAALKTLVVHGLPVCLPHFKTFSEDVLLAQCFRNRFNILPYVTRDEEGGERYMPFQPGHHLTFRKSSVPENDWYLKYSFDLKFGLDHCAARSVAFHYIKPPLMKRMHAILYHLCGR